MSRAKGRGKRGYMQDRCAPGAYWQTAVYNQQLFFALRDQVLQLAMSRFRWINLPEHCDERFMEYTLATQGLVTISYPKKRPGVFYSTQCSYKSPLNVYDNPTRWQSIGNNGWHFDAGARTGVLVWDNKTRYPLMNKVNIYVHELVDILCTKKTNRVSAKTPYILTGPKERELDMINLFKQVAGNEPAVIATDSLDLIDVKVLKTGAEYIPEKFNSDYMNVWNMIYTTLGISNLPFKTERQIEDEVKSITEPSMLYRLNSLDCRRAACEELNKRFARYLDAPVSCVWNDDLESANFNTAHNLETLLDLDAFEGGAKNDGMA